MMGSNRKRILLIVDGSEQSFEVVRYAKWLFSPQDTEIVLFHVLDHVPDAFWDWEKDPLIPRQLEYMTTWEGQKERRIRAFMHKAHDVLTDAGFPGDSVLIRIQKRKDGIARDIVVESETGYSALLFGRKGQSTLDDQLMGSVAHKLLARQGTVPLCLVGGRPRVGKVLIGLDNSRGAQRSVEVISEMTRGTRHSVILLHVIRSIQSVEDQTFSSDQTATIEERARNVIQPAFEKAIGTLTKAGVDPARIETAVVTGASSRSTAILKEALFRECGTIAIGRRGLSDVEEFDMGRVAGKLTQMGKNFAIWVVS